VIGRKKFALLRRRDEFHSHYTVLDIGTEFVKALVVKREEGTSLVSARCASPSPTCSRGRSPTSRA
jgi:cell division ATPase FtsA